MKTSSHQKDFEPQSKIHMPSLSSSEKSSRPSMLPTQQLSSLAAIIAALMSLFQAITQTSMEEWAKVSNNLSTGLIALNNQLQNALEKDSGAITQYAKDNPNPTNGDAFAALQQTYSTDQTNGNIVTQQGQTNMSTASQELNDLGQSSSTETSVSQSLTSVSSNLAQLLSH